MTVRRILSASVLYLTLAAVGAPGRALDVQEGQDHPQPAKKSDLFFAGTVVDSASGKITVSRVVLGKTQRRAFRITPDTKIDGKLRARVRVTVQYITDEDGIDVATLVIVRTAQPRQK